MREEEQWKDLLPLLVAAATGEAPITPVFWLFIAISI